MTIYEMFVQMWIIDYEMKLEPFDKPYFQGLVQSGQLQAEDYAKIVGEPYATTNPANGTMQAQ